MTHFTVYLTAKLHRPFNCNFTSIYNSVSKSCASIGGVSKALGHLKTTDDLFNLRFRISPNHKIRTPIYILEIPGRYQEETSKIIR